MEKVDELLRTVCSQRDIEPVSNGARHGAAIIRSFHHPHHHRHLAAPYAAYDRCP